MPIRLKTGSHAYALIFESNWREEQRVITLEVVCTRTKEIKINQNHYAMIVNTAWKVLPRLEHLP